MGRVGPQLATLLPAQRSPHGLGGRTSDAGPLFYAGPALVNPTRVLYSYFTAGSGGAGPTILETSFLLAGEDVVAYKVIAPNARQQMQQRTRLRRLRVLNLILGNLSRVFTLPRFSFSRELECRRSRAIRHVVFSLIASMCRRMASR